MNLRKISIKFKHLMQRENVNGALKLLTNNVSNGLLLLTDGTLHLLLLLQGTIKQVHPLFEES